MLQENRNIETMLRNHVHLQEQVNSVYNSYQIFHLALIDFSMTRIKYWIDLLQEVINIGSQHGFHGASFLQVQSYIETGVSTS